MGPRGGLTACLAWGRVWTLGALGAAALSLCACDAFSKGGALAPPEEEAAPLAQANVEQPGAARVRWRPSANEAEKITGNLTVSTAGRGGLTLAFAAGQTLRLQAVSFGDAREAMSRGGKSWSETFSTSGDTRVSIYQVVEETIAPTVKKGLCAGGPTKHVAIAETDEGLDRTFLHIASFAGQEAPGPLAVSPGPCLTLRYTPI